MRNNIYKKCMLCLWQATLIIKKNAYRVGAYAPFTVPTPTLHLWVQYFLNYGLSTNYSHLLQEPQSGLRYEH